MAICHCGRLNFLVRNKVKQLKIVSQMRIFIDECVVQFSVITKEWSSDSISLKDLLIRIVVMWFWFEHKISFNLAWGMDRRLLKRNYNESLVMSLLEILCSSCSLCVLCVLHAFFLFKGLWWKFFGALEAWIRRALLICGLLSFLEAFKLDFSEFWDLGIWFW